MGPRAERHGAFISYARRDGEGLAYRLRDRLKSEAPDLHVWIDREDMEPGRGWQAQIEAQIELAEVMLVVLTPAALESPHTRTEWQLARELGVSVYPLLHGPSFGPQAIASLPRWLQRRQRYDIDTEWPKLVARLRQPGEALRVPFMARPLPEDHVPRAALRDALVAHLVDDDGEPCAATLALRGGGGFGKTTLALEVCHDQRVREAFDDGVLWLSPGQGGEVRLLAELNRLHRRLTGRRDEFLEVDDAVSDLSRRLARAQCLLVIDDVWGLASLQPLLRIGGPGCARLITTRLADVALRWQVQVLGPMDDALALRLLQAQAGRADARALRPLLQRLGGWPLPLKLAGAAVRSALALNADLRAAVGHVLQALDAAGPSSFEAQDGASTDTPFDRTVDASLDLLDAAARQRCLELAVLPAARAVPLAQAAQLWALAPIDATLLAQRLHNLGLVELDLGSGSLALHDLLRQFLLRQLQLGGARAAVHQRLLQRWGDPYALPHRDAWASYGHHLVHAGQADRLRGLLLDLRWLTALLAATSMGSVLATFDELPREPALDALRDTLRLTAPLLSDDPKQLGWQLAARLPAGEAGLAELRAAAAAAGDDAPFALALCHATLDTAGGWLRSTLAPHRGEVAALAFDGVGERLLSGARDAELRVTRVADGELLALNDRIGLGVRGGQLDAAGTLALVGGGDGRLYRWRFEQEPAPLALRRARERAITGVAMSADGRVALVLTRRRSGIEHWDLVLDEERALLLGHDDEVLAVALSDDGRTAVSASEDGTLRVWQLPSGKALHVLRGHRGAVRAVALGGSGRLALSGGIDGSVRLWDAHQGQLLASVGSHEAAVYAVALSEDGERAISGAANHEVRLWDLSRMQPLARLDGHAEAVTAVAIDVGGRRAASASADGIVRLWQTDGQPHAPAAEGHGGAVLAVALSSDARLCASGAADGSLMVREVAGGRVLRHSVLRHPLPLTMVAFSADDSCVVAGALDGSCWLWPIEDGDSHWIPVRPRAPQIGASMAPGHLAASGADRRIELWEMPGGVLVDRVGTRRLFDPLIEPAPQRAAAAGDDRLQRADRYFDRERVFQARALTLDATGRHLVVAATADTTRSPRDPVQQVALAWLDRHTDALRCLPLPEQAAPQRLCFDPRTQRLLLAREDGALECWSFDPAECVRLQGRHAAAVTGVALVGDGRFGVTAAQDRQLCLWDLADGRLLARHGFDAGLRCLCAGAGSIVAVGDGAGRVHLLAPRGRGG